MLSEDGINQLNRPYIEMSEEYDSRITGVAASIDGDNLVTVEAFIIIEDELDSESREILQIHKIACYKKRTTFDGEERFGFVGTIEPELPNDFLIHGVEVSLEGDSLLVTSLKEGSNVVCEIPYEESITPVIPV